MKKEKYYNKVDNQCIDIVCWFCGNNKFTTPRYTIEDVKYATRASLCCLKCHQTTFIGLHHDVDEMTIIVRKTEL